MSELRMSVTNPPVATVIIQIDSVDELGLGDMEYQFLSEKLGEDFSHRKSENELSFTDMSRRLGLKVTKNSLITYTGNHTGIDDLLRSFLPFIGYFNEVSDTDLQLHVIGLRYVNVFVGVDSPGNLIPQLQGFQPGELDKYGHKHCKTDFWCETDAGRLIVRTSTVHGSSLPNNLGFATETFDRAHLSSFADVATHLDLFEYEKFETPKSVQDITPIILSMNAQIRSAFVKSLSAKGLESCGIINE